MRGPGFSYARNLDGSAYVPSLLYIIGKSSVTFTVGDAVRIDTSGFCDICAAGEYILGFVAQVVTRAEKAKDPDSGTLHDYTMASDNETSAKDMIGIIPALPNYLFFNDSDGNMDESHIGMYFDLISESQVDETSGDDSTTKSLRLWEYDPDNDADASKGLFNVVESQIYNADCDREAHD